MTDELEALERRGWEALSAPGGADFYRELMLDAGLMVFPGMVMSKDDALAAIAGAEPWSSFTLEDVVVARDDDAATVTYVATAQRGDARPYRAVMSSTYLRRDGRWRLLLHQQSPSAG